MVIILPFHQKDAADMLRLVVWIRQLGNCSDYRAILCVDAATDYALVNEVFNVVQATFGSAEIISNKNHVEGWIAGANSLFLTAAAYVKKKKLGAWLWLEPDSIPVQGGWIQLLDQEYQTCGKPYLGDVISGDTMGMPKEYLNGLAIFPEKAIDQMGPLVTDSAAFDISTADLVVPQTHRTRQIHVFWGEAGLPPTFLSQKHASSPVNSLTLDFLRPETCVFTRNKDGSLIRLLWNKLYPGTLPREGFIVVLPFWNGDAPMAIKNVKWQTELNQERRYDCVLSYDTPTIGPFVHEMEQAAFGCYRNVYHHRYPTGPSGWPAGPNHAFQQAALHMQTLGRPWLWMESDMIPLCPDWLDQLQAEYVHCGKTIMGSMVPYLGHLNGTSIYPANLPIRSPAMMNCRDQAFDTVGKNDVLVDFHDASSLMAHCWGIENGMPHPFVGSVATFPTRRHVEMWVPGGPVTFHRTKDGTLIDRLREIKNHV